MQQKYYGLDLVLIKAEFCGIILYYIILHYNSLYYIIL